ncbi:transcriptional regulator, LuxR family [Anaeromyxobacter dehalogenans 2CP-1]|uniref:Transcriptional regulator, LuxR family n=1 Tax=Anaeromyxobacter dehalogenans (strain ATCC BAA-258 / DSM 21875 / 2CP-1) TaxID=455488 RepID=B8J6B9_ANAD2|nr:LuxR C-terminal-related transcriptional regulator [Anaeromyxobacter dehalogenans]ACL65100.1 transcriptional regulator, LuxR family [Anaeromyxobacter dehalogenans 2CP-1]
MPDRRAGTERVERDVAALCRRGLPWTTLWEAARGRVADAIPFEAAAFAATDPATLLPTAGVLHELPDRYCAAILDNEIREDDYDKLSALARGRRHVGVLGVSTAGRPERSARYRDVLAPIGLGRQARSACVAGGGCWAWLDLYRERGRPEFTGPEAEALGRIARSLAEALRASLLLEGASARAPEDAPGLVLLGPGLERVAADSAAERWLEELGGDGAAPPLALQAVAAAARRRDEAGEAAGPPRVRARARSGRWLTVHGFRPAGRAGVELAAVIEPVAPVELAELQVCAFGLTPAERRVLQLTLQGLCTKEIAAALGISPYTARDHLTHVFDKTGARSRAQLFARLAAARPPERARAAGPGAILAGPGAREEA